jgi:POT family proton-dependent oligopeptide transporter
MVVETKRDTPVQPEEPNNVSQEDLNNLPHVRDGLPLAVIIVALIGGAERFTYYAVTTPWRKSDYSSDLELV